MGLWPVVHQVRGGPRQCQPVLWYLLCQMRRGELLSGGEPPCAPGCQEWDIGQAGKLMGDKIVYLGKKTTGLDNATNITADAWNESFNIPFTPDKAQCVALERLRLPWPPR